MDILEHFYTINMSLLGDGWEEGTRSKNLTTYEIKTMSQNHKQPKKTLTCLSTDAVTDAADDGGITIALREHSSQQAK